MKRALLVAMTLATPMTVGCEDLFSPLPPPGTVSNGTFLFRGPAGVALDAQAVASKDGRIVVGTVGDLRLIEGSKETGFSEPVAFELIQNDVADVTGLVFGDSVNTLFVGYARGIAVINTADMSLTAQTDLQQPLARLYRDGATLMAVGFNNEIRFFSAATPPQPLGTLQLDGGEGTVRSATLHGGRATLSARGAVWVVDYQDAARPTLVAQHELSLVGDTVRGPTHLFTGNIGALSVIAMPDDATVVPTGPELPPWRMPSSAPILENERLYLVDDEDGTVYVVDVSNPTSPTAVTSLAPDGTRLPCGDVHHTLLDDNSVLWVACEGGLVSYVIDF